MKTITNITYSALTLFALACLALLPEARATCQDACLTNFNTAQGDDALASLTTGAASTAFGAEALFSATSAAGNTAVGNSSLYSDSTGGANVAVGSGALFPTPPRIGTPLSVLEHSRTALARIIPP